MSIVMPPGISHLGNDPISLRDFRKSSWALLVLISQLQLSLTFSLAWQICQLLSSCLTLIPLSKCLKEACYITQDSRTSPKVQRLTVSRTLLSITIQYWPLLHLSGRLESKQWVSFLRIKYFLVHSYALPNIY